MADHSARERLLFKADLTFVKAIDILRACEAAKSKLDQMQETTSLVHQLSNGAINMAEQRHHTLNSHRHHCKGEPPCKGCGRNHPRGRCWASDKDCHTCGQRGHLARYCTKQPKFVHAVDEIDAPAGATTQTRRGKSSSDQNPLVVNSISTPALSASDFMLDDLSSTTRQKDWYIDTMIENFQAKFNLDTGASCNV